MTDFLKMSPYNLQTRVAGLEDAPVLARLFNAFNGTSATPTEVAARMMASQNTEVAILAENNGLALGYACLRVLPTIANEAPYAELTELYVMEEWRRQGVGRALMRHVESIARANMATELVLLTGLTNALGQAFYRAVGYTDYALAMRSRL